jgi:glycosyltransferase involved in cell wall biosynthesis
MRHPWLSVIMPTYDGAAYLEPALDRLVAQEEGDFEVIAVDDGSTDDTPRILQAYADRLAMTIVEREHTGNWIANTNHGIGLAKGSYLAILHQDDLWEPDHLAQHRRLTSEWPDASLVVEPCWFIDAKGKRVGRWRCPLPRRTACLSARELLAHLLVQDFIACSAPIFKTEAARRVGGMDESLWYAGDWDFWLKLAGLGQTVYHPVPSASCRVHAASQTCRRIRRTEDIAVQYALVLARHLAAWEEGSATRDRTARIARFSCQANLALMRFLGGHQVGWLGLFWSFLGLGPAGWRRYIHDSRIVERILCRLRAGLAPAPSRLPQQPPPADAPDSGAGSEADAADGAVESSELNRDTRG